ncbi:hypothetical protein PPERSA_01039 [Pseudocohnilembus persalinus]|uniref:Uncharacterized protein n=1 Tax=Pseudocohnilembus persalinus TaxID=266149 RepID=A0A0V0QUC7_PSEPJ|nr:hypothetical protein PPERSA_01039 [Pseudocohnilembus persalinus]|eukprot:KRX05961.1 hypothetical protein PPERSA_01039 [Pseudocohnilembus persalinus]
MQAVDRVIKRNLNLSIYVVIIACLLRILINLILAVNPVWEWYQEERGFPIQAIFSLLIYLGGDMLPCFFFAIMFSPQLEKNIFKRAKLPKFNQQHFQSSAFTDSMISFVAGDDDEDDEQIESRLLDAELGFQE